MRQFSKFLEFSGKSYIKDDIVNAYEQLMDSIDKRKEFIDPKPFDVCLHVNRDFYDNNRCSINDACKTIGEILGNDHAVSVLFTRIYSTLCKVVLSFNESYISQQLPLNAIYGEANVSIFSDKAWRPIKIIPSIKKVIFNPPATIVYWSDGSKTVSKVQEGDTWDSEKGLAMAIIKKTIGLKEFYKHFDEHAVNANFWYYVTPEALARKSVYNFGFKPYMDAIVSLYGTDTVKRYLKNVEESGTEEQEEKNV